jgi:CHAD domain-containing protein
MTYRTLAFDAPKRFRLRSFLSLAADGGPAARTLAYKRIHTTFFDTPDRRLKALGVRAGYRAFEGWSLSVPAEPRGLGPGLPAERTFAGPPNDPPPELRALLAALLCGEPLAAAAESRALEHRVRIPGRNHNDALAIAALDTRRVRAGKSERSGQRLIVDLLDPANAELFASVARLLEEAGAKEVAAPEPERLPKDATAAEAVTRRLHAAYDEFCLAELRLRLLHDVESLHAARVALRRMRACLRVFSNVFAEEWSRGLLERIAALAEVFGQARDADVVVANVAEASERLGPHERAASVEVLAPMLEARSSARRELAAFMNSPHYLELVGEARARIAEPQFRVRAARPARKLVRKLVTRSWKRLERDVRALSDLPDDAALHAVRIRAKRCRYAAEVQIPVAGKRTHRFVHKLGELQDGLGRIQDASLERKWIAAYATGAETATVASALESLVSADVAAAKLDWRRAWDAVRRTHRALA